MKNFLITGGNGFIGSALALELYKQGHKVHILDIAETPNKLFIDYEASHPDEETLLKENINMYQGDLANLTINQMEALIYLVKKNNMFIIHLASSIGVSKVLSNPKETLLTSLQINLNIQRLVEETNAPLIYTSSSEVFGTGEITDTSDYKIPSFEKSKRGSYAAQKVLSEFLFESDNSCIVRFFNIVGEYQTTNGMIMVEIKKAIEFNRPFNVLENGFRSYCYIDDAVTQLMDIINYYNEHNAFEYRSKNIGNASEENYSDVVSILEKLNVPYVLQPHSEFLPIRKLISSSNNDYLKLDDILNKLFKKEK